MNRKTLVGFVGLLAFAAMTAVPPQAAATLYDRTICPPFVGTLVMQDGFLSFIVETIRGDKTYRGCRVRITNPEGASDKEIEKRGMVRFNAHQAKGGGLFVHWESLKDEPVR
jgi:hypothetical protein